MAAAFNANIEATTTEMWRATMVNAIQMGTPMLAMLFGENRVSWKGGYEYRVPLMVDTLSSLAQEYQDNTPLSNQDMTIASLAKFSCKTWQIPLQISDRERRENRSVGEKVDLAKTKVDAGQMGARRKMTEMMFTAGSTDAGTAFQSIPDACDHNRTYGGITCTALLKLYWSGASFSGAFNDRATARIASLAIFDHIFSTVRLAAPDAQPGNFVAVMGTILFNAFKQQIVARSGRIDRGESLAKYGFNTFMYDGVEFVEEPWLGHAWSRLVDAGADTRAAYFFLLYKPSWKLILDPEAAMTLSEFTDQKKIVNGRAFRLARILAAGNLVCELPPANYWSSGMTP